MKCEPNPTGAKGYALAIGDRTISMEVRSKYSTNLTLSEVIVNLNYMARGNRARPDLLG